MFAIALIAVVLAVAVVARLVNVVINDRPLSAPTASRRHNGQV